MSNSRSLESNVSVLWGDMDGFGHVNNIIYLKWCETARIELFRKIWKYKVGNMEEILEKGGVGPILANFNMDYKHPVKYPDDVKIRTYITHIGTSSLGIGMPFAIFCSTSKYVGMSRAVISSTRASNNL